MNLARIPRNWIPSDILILLTCVRSHECSAVLRIRGVSDIQRRRINTLYPMWVGLRRLSRGRKFRFNRNGLVFRPLVKQTRHLITDRGKCRSVLRETAHIFRLAFSVAPTQRSLPWCCASNCFDTQATFQSRPRIRKPRQYQQKMAFGCVAIAQRVR